MGKDEATSSGRASGWELLCKKAAGWSGAAIDGYLDPADFKSFGRSEMWRMSEAEWAAGFGGLGLFARLMSLVFASSDVALEDWPVAVHPSEHARAAETNRAKPCTCGEAGGLAEAHNPGARGCLANRDEAEERLLITEIRSRADKATEGPFDVHRYDNDSGLISYQLQQTVDDGRDALVLCAFDDEENPRAARDADFYAHARADVHRLTDLVVSLRANVTWLVGERVALDAGREAAVATSKEAERSGERYSPSPAVLQRSSLAMALVSRSVSAHHAADAFEVEAAELRSQVHRLLEREAHPLMVLRLSAPNQPSPTIAAERHLDHHFAGPGPYCSACGHQEGEHPFGGEAPTTDPLVDLDEVCRDVAAARSVLELLDDEEKVEEGGPDEAVEAAATFSSHLRRLISHAECLSKELDVVRALLVTSGGGAGGAAAMDEPPSWAAIKGELLTLSPTARATITTLRDIAVRARDENADLRLQLKMAGIERAVTGVELRAREAARESSASLIVCGDTNDFWTRPIGPPWWTYAALSIPFGLGVRELAFLEVAHTYAAALRTDPAQQAIVFRVNVNGTGMVVDVEVKKATMGERGGR